MKRKEYDHASRVLSQAVWRISSSSWRICLLRFFILTVFVGTLPLMTAFAAAFTVTNLNDSGPGSLRDAIATANGTAADDEIVFAPGLNGTITLTTGELIIANNGSLSIDGEERITVSGNDASRVFSINVGANASLNGLTITQGLTIVADDPPFGIEDGGGGGIHNNGGTVTITNSTLSGNSVIGGGGGIYNSGTATIINSTLSGNSGFNGGGIENYATVTITNSTLSGNSAIGGGGDVIDNYRGTTTIANSIVANSPGGGNCGLLEGTINAQNSLIEDGLDCVNGTNINNLIGDPSLGALTGSPAYFPLLADSIAIDAGDNSLIPMGITTDQAGNPRIRNGTVDMGSFEFTPITVTAIPTLGQIALVVLGLLLSVLGVAAIRRGA